MSIILVIMLFYAVAEIACLAALEIVRIKTGIFFFPKNSPYLSSNSREFYERLIATGGTGTINELHAELGWALRPGLTDRAGLMLTTRGRVRSDREFDAMPPPGTIRIATFGDCLTFGRDVSIGETWQSFMMRAEPACEVLNFGTEGYDAGQMYLNYLRSQEHYAGHHVVLFSVVSSNLFKPLNIFRLFYAYDHGLPLAKPGFRVVRSRLEHIPNPLPRLADYENLLKNPTDTLEQMGRDDYYFAMKYRRGIGDILPSLRLLKLLSHEYKKYSGVFDRRGIIRNSSAAFVVSASIYAAMAAAVTERGAQPLFLLLPLEHEVRRFRRTGVKTYQPIIDLLASHSLQTLDLLDEIGTRGKESPLPTLFAKRHFTPAANAFIADCVLKKIRVLCPSLTSSGRGES